jgi:hypothetical protein
MATIKAQFDGHVFVPCEPLNLPIGTKVEVLVPTPPSELTSEEKQGWDLVVQELRSTEPPFSTVDEAIRYSRKQP